MYLKSTFLVKIHVCKPGKQQNREPSKACCNLFLIIRWIIFLQFSLVNEPLSKFFKIVGLLML